MLNTMFTHLTSRLSTNNVQLTFFSLLCMYIQLRFHNSHCVTAECGEDEFTCSNKFCVPIARRCDQDNDCGDLSDEKNCSEYELYF